MKIQLVWNYTRGTPGILNNEAASFLVFVLNNFSPNHQRLSHIPEPKAFLNTELDNNVTYNRKLLVPRSTRHGLKRQRIETCDAAVAMDNPFFALALPSSHTGHTISNQALDTSNTPVMMRRPKVDLSPCHICRRKPTVKSELDAFADCEECMERTCYICIRECLGIGVRDHKVVEMEQDSESLHLSFTGTYDGMDLGGHNRFGFANTYDTPVFDCDGVEEKDWRNQSQSAHKRMICSRCCVEKGTEGEVWCLGCLRSGGPD